MKLEQSAARRTEVGPVQTIAVGPVETIVPMRLKRLALFHRHPLRRWLHTPTCDTRVREQLDSARPFVTWLNENVGPSTRPRPQ